MTKRTLLGFLIACSLTLNAAFLGVWLVHSIPSLFNSYQCTKGLKDCRKCPLQAALDMNESQWVLIEPRIKAFHESSAIVYKEIADSRAALIDELEKPQPDSAAILMCRERIQIGQNKMQLLVVSHILDEKSILTPEQQKRFFKMMRVNMTCSGMPGMMGTMSHKCGKPNTSAGEQGRHHK
jgi:Spy/CpxP family protein refolding chaperone